MKKKILFLAGGWLFLLMISYLVLKDNFIFFMKWYVSLLLVGLIFFPISSALFTHFKDGGWNFSKVLGFAIPGLMFWLFSYARIFKNTNLNSLLIFLPFVIGDIIWINKNRKQWKAKIDEMAIPIFTSELLFLGLFLFWTLFKCYTASINPSTEKYMNYGFINQLYYAEYMPAEDMWLSGNIINYYYFGHYLASFLAKITFSQVNETFNLFNALVATMTFVAPFHICYHLGYYMKERKNTKSLFLPITMGVMGAIAVSLGGSLYYPIYTKIVDREALGLGTYYYWEDSRYIGYRPDTNDQVINEIIPYSNALGDLHAHHMGTILVFVTVALLLDLLLENQEKEDLLSLKVLVLGCLLGMHKMVNYWDFPIYLVLIILSYMFHYLSKEGFHWNSFLDMSICILEIVFISSVVTLPFTTDLYMPTTGVALCETHSPFYKMCVFWALPVISVLLLVGILVFRFCVPEKVKKKNKEKKEKKESFWTHLSSYLNEIHGSDLFIFIVGCSAIGLILIPEIIYVKDIYTGAAKRANTVYKLCYQADWLFDISVSFILIKMLCMRAKWFLKIIPSLMLIAFISTFGYGVNAINYSSEHFSKDKFLSLSDTEDYLKKDNPREYQAVEWIKENIPHDAVILEKPCASFRFFGYVSVLTAHPTVIGWHGHEWLWHANSDFSCPFVVSSRWSDLWNLYHSTDLSYMHTILDKYQVKYLYISNPKEDDEWKITNTSELLKLGEVVYSDTGENEEEPIYIVKVR